MFKVGQVFKSKNALKRCLAQPSSVQNSEGSPEMVVNHKSLKPNVYSEKTDRRVGMMSVWFGSEKLGYINCISNDESRQDSLWEITHVDVNGAGCGNGHHVGAVEMAWAKYECVARRINPDGTVHDSGETVSFSNAGMYTINDLEVVSLQKAA